MAVLAHVDPAAAQTGSWLHAHLAEPAAPLQVWCVPQPTGVL